MIGTIVVRKEHGVVTHALLKVVLSIQNVVLTY